MRYLPIQFIKRSSFNICTYLIYFPESVVWNFYYYANSRNKPLFLQKLGFINKLANLNKNTLASEQSVI